MCRVTAKATVNRTRRAITPDMILVRRVRPITNSTFFCVWGHEGRGRGGWWIELARLLLPRGGQSIVSIAGVQRPESSFQLVGRWGDGKRR